MLANYAKTVLLITDAVEVLGRTIATQVKLKHIESLWNILEEMTDVDPFSKVHEKYRKVPRQRLLPQATDSACNSLLGTSRVWTALQSSHHPQATRSLSSLMWILSKRLIVRRSSRLTGS